MASAASLGWYVRSMTGVTFPGLEQLAQVGQVGLVRVARKTTVRWLTPVTPEPS